MEKTMKRYGVNHRFSTSYHPQTSGQVENTNRALKRILEKTVKDNPAIWSRKLDDALWVFCIAYKTPTDYYSEDQYAVSIKEDTAYPCLHSPKTTEDKAQYAVSRETQYAVKMDNLSITIEEYIRLEEEKAHRRGKVYNWKTATYGRSGIMKTFTTSDLLKLNSQL
ncbi:reverse transcriptase domain-containing protein [Tanacetum coccineum]